MKLTQVFLSSVSLLPPPPPRSSWSPSWWSPACSGGRPLSCPWPWRRKCQHCSVTRLCSIYTCVAPADSEEIFMIGFAFTSQLHGDTPWPPPVLLAFSGRRCVRTRTGLVRTMNIWFLPGPGGPGEERSPVTNIDSLWTLVKLEYKYRLLHTLNPARLTNWVSAAIKQVYCRFILLYFPNDK